MVIDGRFDVVPILPVKTHKIISMSSALSSPKCKTMVETNTLVWWGEKFFHNSKSAKGSQGESSQNGLRCYILLYQLKMEGGMSASTLEKMFKI